MRGLKRIVRELSQESLTFPKQLLLLVGILLSTCFLIACANVKPYQRAYLNDSEMGGADAGMEEYVQAIREGSSGGGAEKGSGGCGCN